ncbi:MAG: hypothetical protein VX066_06030 [Pseudomonadota bacterium]|nr:hypothetical protein [Pseudomonadota bacterium]
MSAANGWQTVIVAASKCKNKYVKNSGAKQSHVLVTLLINTACLYHTKQSAILRDCRNCRANHADKFACIVLEVV